MNIARFRRLSQALGADLDRWPVAEREAAEALLARSDEARRLLNEARALDRWLDQAAIEVDDATVSRLSAAIVSRVDRLDGESQGRSRGRIQAAVPVPWMRPRSLWPATAFLAAMGIVGFLAGESGLLFPHAAETSDFATLVAPQSIIIAWVQ
jgi:hypothetical protein